MTTRRTLTRTNAATFNSFNRMVLTTGTYEDSLAFYNAGRPPQPNDFSSAARFYRTADMIKNYDPVTAGPA